MAVNDQLSYAVVEIQPSASVEGESETSKSGKGKTRSGSALRSPQLKYVVVAADLIPALQAKWGVSLETKGTFPGSALEHCRCTLPTCLPFRDFVYKSIVLMRRYILCFQSRCTSEGDSYGAHTYGAIIGSSCRNDVVMLVLSM